MGNQEQSKNKKTNIYKEKIKSFHMPTKWMRFYIFVFLPVLFILLLLFNLYFSLVFYISLPDLLFFALFTAVWLIIRKLKKIGYFLNILLSLYPAVSAAVYNIIVVPTFGDLSSAAVLWSACAIFLFLGILNIVYFYKRRTLFS